ncbi:MAG: TonB-dependent receptor [Xanthomonadaceae bacterium]|nr:TonB-dependent receptor [Xanthomonadaceae bacterium]
MNRIHRCFSVAAMAASLVFVPLSTGAREAPARQPEVVVTASRHAQTVDTVLASVTVLTRAEIAASQAPDLIDLLGRQAGIDVSRTGGPGSSSTLFVRGANSNQTLILIDGIRVNATGQGLIDLAHLPPDQIERIEIVRGPRAALWGSDAIGGVIHIFTRDAAGPSASLRAGRWGRAEAQGSFGTVGERGAFAASAGYRRLDGFSATGPAAFGHDPDNDGYWQRHASARGHLALGSQTLEIAGFGSDADVEFDQGRSEARNISGGATLTGALGLNWQHRLGYGHAREDLETAAFDSRFESRRNNLDWLHSLDLPAVTATAGLSWQREEGRSLSAFSDPLIDRSRRNLAGFVSAAGALRGIEWQSALRYDDNSQFGGESTASLALGWRPADWAKLRASWGEGFRAPNFNELYSPGFGGLFAGNPDLDPERSRSLELGLDIELGEQRIALSAFDNRVRDQISFDGPQFQAVNIDRARTRGLEIEQRWQAGVLAGRNALTVQDAEDRDTGLALLRRPQRRLSSGLDWRVSDTFGLGVDADLSSSRRDFDGRLGGYALFHLRATWSPAPDWQIQARLENLTDRDYQLASGFNTPGRNLLVALHWQPGR